MMNSDYSIANGLTGLPNQSTVARVPASVNTLATNPTFMDETPIMVIPRSTVGSEVMPAFPSAMDMNQLPMTAKFTASPRSLSTLPTVTDTSTPVGSSTGDIAQILASLVDSKKNESKATSSSGDSSSKILLDTIRELKEELLADKGDSSVKKGSLKKAKSPTPAKNKLVSSSPRSEAAVKA
jgi:hypothetical protein